MDMTQYEAKELEERERINGDNPMEGTVFTIEATRVVATELRAQAVVMDLTADGKKYVVFVNGTSVRNLRVAYGPSSDAWTGKTLHTSTESMLIKGKKKRVLILLAP